MKKSLLGTLILACSSLLILDSCKKQSNDVWDDSSNVGSYKRAKERILWGNSDTSEITALPEIKGPSSQEEDFIPLQDDDLKEQFSDLAFAQPKDSPGEESSFLPGIDGFSLPTGALAQVFKTVYFNTDEFALKKPEHLQAIQNVASYLKAHPNTYIFVSGFCDQRGPEAYNLALGARRSNYIRNLLIQEGANGDQIHTISYGKERLADSHNTPEAWAKNRRAEFKIYQKR